MLKLQGRHESTTAGGEWLSLGTDHVVRRFDLPQQDLSRTPFACSMRGAQNPCGGDYAVFFDEDKNTTVGKSGGVSLYTSAGAYQRTVAVPAQQPVVFLCWNEATDELLVVLADRTVYVYNSVGRQTAAALTLDRECLLFSATGSGLAALQTDGDDTMSPRFVTVLDRNGGGVGGSGGSGASYHLRTVSLPKTSNSGLGGAGACLLPIPPSSSSSSRGAQSGVVEVLVVSPLSERQCAVGSCTFDSSPMYRSFGVVLDESGVRCMALCPRGDRVALVTAGGSVCVTTRTFQEVTYLVRLAAAPVSQLRWCGAHSIVAAYVDSDGATRADGGSAPRAAPPSAPAAAPAAALRLTLLNADEESAAAADGAGEGGSVFLGPFPADSILSQEVDGVRVIGYRTSVFLKAALPEAVRVFRPPPGPPAAPQAGAAGPHTLLRRFDEYCSGSASSVSIVSDFRGRPHALSGAVEACVAAATEELHPRHQKRLMRVAALGRAFGAGGDPNLFCEAAECLRACNTLLSEHHVHLTYAQLHRLGKERLVQRLVAAAEFKTAFALASFFHLATDAVLSAWALAKLSGPAALHLSSPAERAEPVVGLLRRLRFTSFAALGRDVSARGFRAEALALIALERSPVRAVSALVSIGESKAALERALAAADADLVFTALMHLVQRHGAAAPGVFAGKPAALDLFLKHLRASPSERVRQFLVSLPWRDQLGVHLAAYCSLRTAVPGKPLLSPSTSSSGIGGGGDDSGGGGSGATTLRAQRRALLKDCVAVCNRGEASRTESAAAQVPHFLSLQQSVLEEGERLCAAYKDARCRGASAVSLVMRCIEHQDDATAAELKLKFAIPERTYQCAVLRAYCRGGRWGDVDKLAARKSQLLVPPEVLLEELLAHGRGNQARAYVPRVYALENRLQYYMECGDWAAAAADCRACSRPDLMEELRKRAKGQAEVLAQLEQGWSRKPTSGTHFAGIALPKFFVSS